MSFTDYSFSAAQVKPKPICGVNEVAVWDEFANSWGTRPKLVRKTSIPSTSALRVTSPSTVDDRENIEVDVNDDSDDNVAIAALTTITPPAYQTPLKGRLIKATKSVRQLARRAPLTRSPSLNKVDPPTGAVLRFRKRSPTASDIFKKPVHQSSVGQGPLAPKTANACVSKPFSNAGLEPRLVALRAALSSQQENQQAEQRAHEMQEQAYTWAKEKGYGKDKAKKAYPSRR